MSNSSGSNSIIIGQDGKITIEGEVTPEQENALNELLGLPTAINCALPDPRRYVSLDEYAVPAGPLRANSLPRFHALWHGDVTVGPGVRSVVQFQGCPIRCPGCYVPETHDFAGGVAIDSATITDLLLDPNEYRDGVTILGGEPFAYLLALDMLTFSLQKRGVPIVVYTGFTLEYLCRAMKSRVPFILRSIDVLVDGPYRRSMAAGAGEWRDAQQTISAGSALPRHS